MDSVKDHYGDVQVTLGDEHVAVVELCRPPDNFFDQALMADLADAFEALDRDERCRASVLCSQGKHFCAGANFGAGQRDILVRDGRHLYAETVRLFSCHKPVVAAIQGAAVGGGLGVALLADFRVAAPEARFSANFARLGIHHGFGLSVTLPRLIGQQRAQRMLYLGERIKAEQALPLGLCDELWPLAELRQRAYALCAQIASSAPLAVESIRATLRGDLAEQIRVATARERSEQERLQQTRDFREGVAAMRERRPPRFTRG
jgi:enoyl-CoA hydratase/carnithine racemase